MYNADPDYTLGGELITDTAAHTGRFGCIKALQDSVINTLVAENITGDLTGLQFKSNTAIEGIITSVKLDSGTVIAYLV